jgi:hypothetical protein
MLCILQDIFERLKSKNANGIQTRYNLKYTLHIRKETKLENKQKNLSKKTFEIIPSVLT